MAVGEQLYTVEEFEQIADSDENAGRLLELINGEIIEKVPTEEHGVCTSNIHISLATFAHPRKLGRVVIEVRYHQPGDERNAFIPDLSFSTAKRPMVKQGSVPEMPDLAVEIQSPDQSLKKLREKVRYFLAHGTRLFWLVIPEKQLVEVYSPTDEQVLNINDTLSGGDVLPGFTLAVRDIFHDPLEESE
ncbi:MAG TPA: Uma2 family endonuclease [Phototrophicaceae bacterium]|nr:Uma2 family endonuclease [Phototrophicaceae bacterium]